MQRVLILGGYGVFGGRVAERLAQVPGIEVIVAGRREAEARAFAERLAGRVHAKVSGMRLDAAEIPASVLGGILPAVTINATGPYQGQDYRVARACIAAGVHYVDLADARGFVTGIAALDREARRAGVLVVSGASTVPAVSGAVVDAHAARFSRLEAVETTIAPGNSFDPGIATTRSILDTLGRPLAAPGEAAGARSHGWQGPCGQRSKMPGLGGRWRSRCDAPDIELFVLRYQGLESVKVYAALEVGMFHLGLWALSWLVRGGLLRDPERLAAPLIAAKRRLGFLGSNRGGLLVTLEGTDTAGARKRLDWHLVAGSGHGPFVPATPAVLIAKRLLDGTLVARGAVPCLGLFTLGDLLAEIADLDITVGVA